VGIEPWLAVAAILPFILTAALTVHAASSTGPPRLVLLGPLVGLALMYGTGVAPRTAVYAARGYLLVATARWCIAPPFEQPASSGTAAEAGHWCTERRASVVRHS
jgi:hypothetical protein